MSLFLFARREIFEDLGLEPISSIRVTCLTPCGVEKRTTTLVCEANGTPSPEYSWSYGQVSQFQSQRTQSSLFFHLEYSIYC